MKPLFLLLASAPLCLADANFPQWRGPLRNGVLLDSPKLLDTFPKDGLKELWESEKIPANDEGGLASPVVLDGKVYISLVWHRDEPSETRQISDLVMRQLGWQNPKSLGKELVDKMEAARENLPPTLRGKKLDEFAKEFIEANLDKKQKQLFSGFVTSRFRKGKQAMPLDVLEKLEAQQGHVFANEGELKAWLDAQGWSESIRQQVLEKVPPTKRVAEDAVVALDLATGKTLWKTSLPGAPLGRSASSTPVVADGKVFAVASTRVWCVNTADGKVIWEAPLKGNKRGIGSSPLLVDNVVAVNLDRLTGFDATTGKELWKQEKAGGGNSSPVAWKAGDKSYVICNGRADLAAVDAKTGAIAWTAPGGGDSTPAISGETLVVQTRKPDLGIVCYALATVGATQRWNFPTPEALRTQSSPVIYNGAVYFMEDNNHYCFDLANGSQRWVASAQSTIASPILADGKLFAMANNGNTVIVVKADPSAYTELGRLTVRAQWVPSPCLADGKLVLRMKDSVKAWSLAR